MTDLSDLDVNQLLTKFLDACGADFGYIAFETIDELRYRIWNSGFKRLPRDPRQQPEELVAARARITETERLRAENKRLLAASVTLDPTLLEELIAARARITETERLRAENKRLLAASVALAQCRDALLHPFPGSIKYENERMKAIVAVDAALK